MASRSCVDLLEFNNIRAADSKLHGVYVGTSERYKLELFIEVQ